MDQTSSTTSGAAKRRKLKLKAESRAKLPKITSFFRTSEDPGNSNEGPSCSSIGGTAGTEIESQECRKSKLMELTAMEIDHDTLTQINPESDNSKLEIEEKEETFKGNPDILEDTDIGKFQNAIMTDNLKRLIIMSPSSRPTKSFPRDPSQNNRKFSQNFYQSQTKYGSVERLWLCYSNILDSVYCEPCWLFSNNKKDQWRTGIREWQNLSLKISRHELSQSHLSSCYIYEKWSRNDGLIDKNIEQQLRHECCFWGQVLERLFHITLSLAKNSSAFRGHRESFSDTYNGHFLSQVQVLAKYDDIMKQVITIPKGKIKYLSHQIQNEIIHCLAVTLRRNLVSKLKAAPFFSIIMDTTQDITKKNQLSQVYRYVEIVKNDNNIPTSIKIQEIFLGFCEITDHSAIGMASEILKLIEKHDIDIALCRGQGYDGASVMSGVYGGVQALIKQRQPNACYVHCAAHNLNLVISDAVKISPAVETFFGVLEEIYVFFGTSMNRWDLLSKFTGESVMSIKRLNPTRWSGRYKSLLAIKLRYLDILKALTEIILKSNKKDEREQANRIKKRISSFEFVFILVILSKILSELHVSSQLLQSRDFDLFQAAEVLKIARGNLEKFRNDYNLAKLEAVGLALQWGIDAKFPNKRMKVVKRHHDELAKDFRFHNNEHHFRVNIFTKVLDVVCNQLYDRFQGMNEICSSFNFLKPKAALAASKNDLLKSSKQLQMKYSHDLSSEFPLQMVMLVEIMNEELSRLNSVRELAELVLINHPQISSSIPEVVTALLLFLTIPVTSANAERSFSKLKIIKNHLRNTQSEKRLSDLSLLSIEAEQAEQLDLKTVAKLFADSKVRRKKFI